MVKQNVMINEAFNATDESIVFPIASNVEASEKKTALTIIK